MAAGLFRSRGWTSLQEAASHPKELQCLEKLLKNGAIEVNQQDQFGETPLHVACRGNSMEGVKETVCLLLQNGANVNIPNKRGESPLLYAVMTGNLDVVATLLSAGHADPNLGDKFGQTPVHKAVFGGHWEIVEYLLQAGAFVPGPDKNGVTPVYLAAKHGQSCCLEKLLQLSLGKGQKELVDLPCRDGFTPLMGAAKNGHMECVQVLLKFGANPNSEMKWKAYGLVTALYFAINGDHAECIELLLDKMDLQHLVHHADAISTGHACLLHATIKKRNHTLLKRLLSLGVPVDNVHKISDSKTWHSYVSLFAEKGPFPEYETSLSYAAALKDIDSMQILLDYGASVNPVLHDVTNKNEVQQKLSLPPILSALRYKSWKAFDFLIENGCDISCQPEGVSASECLLWTVDNYDATKKLLMCGSDPYLIFQQRNHSYLSVVYLYYVFLDVSCEAFLRVLELLLQFVAISQPVQRFCYDVFKLFPGSESSFSVNECHATREAILQQVDKPSSLRSLCRIKIRHVMISVHGYKSFRAAIHHLCLPEMLKEYLLYSER